MTIVKRLPVCLCILGFCFFIGTLLDLGYYHFFGPGLWQPTIVCDKAIQHWGKLSSVKQCPSEFVIRNIGSRPLNIHGVKPSCGGCVKVISFPKPPILPGEKGIIRVALLTDKLQGLVEKSVIVLSNDPKTPALVLRLHANIVKPSPAKATINHASR